MQKTWNEAHEECCKYGLKLLSVESQVEINCLHTAFNSTNQRWVTAGKMCSRIKMSGYSWTSGLFWTGASSDGINCERKWAWCPNRTDWILDSLRWSSSRIAPLTSSTAPGNMKPGVQHILSCRTYLALASSAMLARYNENLYTFQAQRLVSIVHPINNSK